MAFGTLFSGCAAEGDGSPVAGGSCVENGTETSISSNHGHTLNVSQSDVLAAESKTYSIQGASAHNHSVILTSEHFASLAEGNGVQVASSSDGGHSHLVTVNCA